MKKEYKTPECMEIGKMTIVTQGTLLGETPDGTITEEQNPDPMGGHTES